MLSLYVLFVALTTVTAEELDRAALEGFQASFYGSIMQHINAEFEVLQPLIEAQNRTMESCRGKIVTAQESCKSCTQSECKGDMGDWIGEQWGTVTDWFEGAGESFIDWGGWQDLGAFFGDVGNWFAGAGSTFINWDGWSDMGNFFSDFGSGIGDFFGDFGSGFVDFFGGFGDAMGDIGSGFTDAFSSIGNEISSWFGRRRRSVGGNQMTARRLQIIRHKYIAKRMEEIDPKARECMSQCSSCQPFLGDQTAIIAGVCGDQVLLDQAAMAEVMRSMEALFNANGNPQQGKEPILKKVEFDRRQMDYATLQCGGVYVTAVTPEGVVTYPSAYKYNLLNPSVTKGELAMELIEMWGL